MWCFDIAFGLQLLNDGFVGVWGIDVLKEQFQGFIFILHWRYSCKQLCEDRLIVELSIELTAGLYIFVKRQINYFSICSDEQLPQLYFILSNIAIQLY